MRFVRRRACVLWLLSVQLIEPTQAYAGPIQSLIERAELFSNPNHTGARLSPDGHWLAWLGPRAGVLNIWVAPVAALARARPLTNERSWPIREFSWAPNSKSILFRNDKDGDEHFSLYGVPLSGKSARNLTPIARNEVAIIGTSRRVPDRILVGISDPGGWDQNVYSLNLANWSLTPVFKNVGHYSCFTVDADLQLRFVCRYRADGGFDFFRFTTSGVDATPFAEVLAEDRFTTHLEGLIADGRGLYWLDSRGRDTAALTVQNLKTGKLSTIASDSKADIVQLLINPRTGRVQAYAVDYQKIAWSAIDQTIKIDLDFLESHLKGAISITSRTDDDKLWTVVQDISSASPVTYLYDKNGRKLIKLFASQPSLPAGRLAAMRPVEILTRDHHIEVGYLTLPSGSRPNRVGRPISPLPMVLLVHGGPNARDDYGFNVTHQWLADRGYAVLSVNFRGSKGFGKSYLAASNHQWGGVMQDDLIDAVNWAISNDIADPRRIAAMGESYGGYATLSAILSSPTTFACGVEFAGPTDLTAMRGDVPVYWSKVSAGQYHADSAADRRLLFERSPLFNVKTIQRPLLVGHGANDPRVDRSESDRLVAAAASGDAAVTYIVFPGEGHGLTRPENVIAFKAVAENFLAKCLGGRSEPIGGAVDASSAIIVRSAGAIPGLKATPSIR